MLFIDYSSAFNTILSSKLIIKLEALGLNPALCNWVMDFLTGHLQVVKVGNNTSTLLAPQGRDNETAYREEVKALGMLCQENNLSPNINKTKELIVDFRKQQREHAPYPHHRDRSGEGGTLQVPQCTHH